MMIASSPVGNHAKPALIVDSGRSWYVLGLLTVAYALAYIDRQMLNLLVDPIKSSLSISDTRFSLIQGSAFVWAYLLAAPLFGRLVDITNRRNILIFSVCAWSLSTAMCGMADSFLMLFIARFEVGVSEACIFPVALSLVADYFSTRRAPRALSFFTLGAQLGGGFSLVAGGLVIAFAAGLAAQLPALRALEPWQMAFVVVGLPGLLFALVLLTLREPPRRHVLASDTADRQMTMREVAAGLWKRRSFYGRLYVTMGGIGIVYLGVPTWFPAFLIRAHGMAPSETGFKLGVLSILMGVAGTLSGPVAAAWLHRRGHTDAPFRVAGFSALGSLLFSLAIPFAPGPAGALVVAAGLVFCCSFPTGILAAGTQHATPSRMRGVVAALYTFFSQLIGYGIGPTAVALFTDRVFHDPKMVGYSMQIVMATASAVAALMLFSALRPYRALMEELVEDAPAPEPDAAGARARSGSATKTPRA